MSYRRVWSLMHQLPQESRTQTILRDKPLSETPLSELPMAKGPRKFGPWSQSDYLLASAIDAMHRVEWTLRRVNGDSKAPFPEPVPRPGMDRPVRRQTPEGVAYLKKLRATGA